MTVNALCLDSLPAMIDLLVSWKRKYGADYPNFTLNILRFPSFQSAVVLPTSIKQECIEQLTKQTHDYYNDLHGMELNQILRLIEYLKEVESPHQGADNVDKLQSDFKNFYSQYDKRRGKTFANTFGNEMVAWYEQL